jgi:hypothetical protein
MECKKCPYYESRKEITNTGKVVIGFCKLRSKHMSDATIRNNLCKDRATIDVPQGSRTIRIEPEKKLFTQEERKTIEKAMGPKPDSLTMQLLSEKKAAEEKMKKFQDQQKIILKPEEKKPQKPAKPGEEKISEELLRKIVWGGGK